MDTAIALAGTFSVTFLLDRGSLADTKLLPTIIQAAGLLGWIWALFTLGRSFGIVAADRGLVAHGPYRLVRHPIYAFELLFFLGYFAAVPTLEVAVIVGIWTLLQCVRIVREEKIIGGYAEYAQTVRWRLAPFIW
jgi:protein-S-isoprenylcysteine O-methyltransferase Ste14